METSGLFRIGAEWSRIASEGAEQGNAAASAGGGFGEVLQRLSDYQAETDTAVDKLVAGEDVDLHEVMISAETTDIAFRVALQLRDKLVRAYEDIMRMQV